MRWRWPLIALLGLVLFAGLVRRYDDERHDSLTFATSENQAAAQRIGFLGDGRIDLNVASLELLTTLPGIGDARAAAIVAGRLDDPYKSLRDLIQRTNLPEQAAGGLADLAGVE